MGCQPYGYQGNRSESKFIPHQSRNDVSSIAEQAKCQYNCILMDGTWKRVGPRKNRRVQKPTIMATMTALETRKPSSQNASADGKVEKKPFL